MNKIIEKNRYLTYFEPQAENALKELEAEAGFSLLSDSAKEELKETILIRIYYVTGSYFRSLTAEQLKDENPLAGFDFTLITKEEYEKVTPVILTELEEGKLLLPDRMRRTIEQILVNFNAFTKEMLDNLLQFRKEICDLLFDGRIYQKITGISTSGDTHNHGKSTSIIETDAGKFVYKPHSCRLDVKAFDFMNRYFSEIIVLPKVFAYLDAFGAVEFLEKKISEGREDAKRYYYALGGTTAVIKMLGTTDMHYENLFACGEKLALIDIETLLYPYTIPEKNTFKILYGKENTEEMNQSVMFTALFNGRIEMPHFEKDFSILSNTEEDGSAPLVDGERKSVFAFKEDFYSGFSHWYDRCMELREAISADITAAFSNTVMRSIIWATKAYGDILRRLNSCYSYGSEDYYASQLKKLPGILKRAKMKTIPQIEEQEIKILMENEIPFFYTYGDSKALYSEGRVIVSDYYDQSAVERTLSIIGSMSEEEKQFELQYMKLTLGLSKIKTGEIPPVIHPSHAPLPPDHAVSEAEKIMEQIYEDALRFMSGERTWLLFEPGRENPDIMDSGLYAGLSGMAVFFAGMTKASANESIRKKAQECLSSCMEHLGRFLKDPELPEVIRDPDRFSLGEGSGIAGILHALVILNHMKPGLCDELIQRAKKLLTAADFSAFSDTDKAGGIAGLLVILCRFEEYYADPGIKEVIRTLAEHLVSLKTLDTENGAVWKTIRDKNHPISGAVHGMTGIAEALYLADLRLHTDAFRDAAKDAITFEDRSYDEKEEDWMDLRVPGSHKYAKGNCYGTEGIGIICDRLMKNAIEAAELPRMFQRAVKSVRRRPPMPLDHLCCGNMSTVDYYLETGDRESAGKLLAAVVDQKEKLGRYRLGYADHLTNNNVTLFYGLSGIGYELIRYTDPERFLTAL